MGGAERQTNADAKAQLVKMAFEYDQLAKNAVHEDHV